jgi:hypothetical protein
MTNDVQQIFDSMFDDAFARIQFLESEIGVVIARNNFLESEIDNIS